MLQKIKLWDENEEEDHSNDSREVHFKMYTNQIYYRYIKLTNSVAMFGTPSKQCKLAQSLLAN